MALSDTVKGIVVALLLASILVPITMTQYVAANTTGWTTSTLAVWAIVPIGAIVGFALKFFDII